MLKTNKDDGFLTDLEYNKFWRREKLDEAHSIIIQSE
jgi:hypothetical protein